MALDMLNGKTGKLNMIRLRQHSVYDTETKKAVYASFQVGKTEDEVIIFSTSFKRLLKLQDIFKYEWDPSRGAVIPKGHPLFQRAKQIADENWI